MKNSFITFLLCICFCASAQTKISKDGKGFNSCFQKLEKGYFQGYADGLMQFEYKDGTTYSISFTKDSAILNIVPDQYKMYDISYKNYVVKTSDIQIEYSTYNLANALIITISSMKYRLSLIDGACMKVITGLEYEYIPFKEKELLKIHFSDKVGLYTVKQYISPESYIPEFYIRKGSTLMFSINK